MENILSEERRDVSSIVSDRRWVVSVNVVGCWFGLLVCCVMDLWNVYLVGIGVWR